VRDDRNPLPPVPTPAEIITILLVSHYPEDHRFLRQTLTHSHWNIYRALDLQQARSFLMKTPVPVALCERNLPDGTWKDLFTFAESLSNPPLFVVMSEVADQYLWSEVLNLGGYDVLAKPFDRSELLQVVGMSWRNWKCRSAAKQIGPARQIKTGIVSPLAS
jgi:DNA-binding response OmpR family regulator